MSPYGVGGGHRHTPEIVQNLSLAAGEPVTLSFTPTLAPMPRGILATCTARVRPGTSAEALRAAWHAAYADEPFVHLLPDGQWPRTSDVLGANTVHLQLAARPVGGPRRRGRRHRQPHQGHRRRCHPVREPRARPARRPLGLPVAGVGPVSRRRLQSALPQGFRAAGVTAGLKASGSPDLALLVNDGPDHHAAAVFTSNRVVAAPVTWSRTVVGDGRVDAVVLNSGGANACTGAQGFQDTHRTAEEVASALDVAASRRRRLLHRTHRRAAADGPHPRRGRRRPRPPSARAATTTPPGRS